MPEHALKDTIYELTKATSNVVCAVHCLQDDSCSSFNYCNGTFCQLKAANYSVNGSDIQLSVGCRHHGDEPLQTEGKDIYFIFYIFLFIVSPFVQMPSCQTILIIT